VRDLPAIAQRYEYGQNDALLLRMRERICARGCLTKHELGIVARWKAARSAGWIAENADEYVREITGMALAARTERTRIEVLTLLTGVGWPMASVVLHFYHKDPYPLLDFRALWTLSLEMPSQCGFDVWWTYVQYCRKLARKTGLDMRTLDRALWQYSKEHQGTS
jgi:hypothetical protein